MNRVSSFFFFFNDTATTEIYTLSLHDALPICSAVYFSVAGSILHPVQVVGVVGRDYPYHELERLAGRGDRKSTRLNSSHLVISYAVFCLKKKTYYSAFPTRATLPVSQAP